MRTKAISKPKLTTGLAIAFAFALFGLAPELAFGALTCRGAFATPDREPVFGEINPEFKHEYKFDVELNGQSPVKNQCQLGTCHLHAWVSQMEHVYQVRTGRPIRLSMEYLAAFHWAQQAILELKKESKVIKIQLGATPIKSRALILEGGVIPEGSWKPLINFMSEPYASRIEASFKNIIARAKSARRVAKTPEEKAAINLAATTELVAVVDSFAGNFENTFEYEGTKYDAHSFLKERFPDLGGYLVTMNVQANPKLNIGLVANRSQMQIDGNINLVEKTARKMIDNGETVYLSYEHSPEFVDNASGVMSMDAFLKPKLGRPLTRLERTEAGLLNGGHAVQIVGYSLDPKTGRVSKWKIKNSWGDKSGNGGYYTMYRDYFRAYARSLTYIAESIESIPKFERRDPFDPAI